MNAYTRSYQRLELVKTLNQTLVDIGKINLNIRNIKNENNNLELELNDKINNNKKYENQINELNEKIEELKKRNEELKKESKLIDENIIEIQKKLEENN